MQNVLLAKMMVRTLPGVFYRALRRSADWRS
ncbi:MAG: hypothetical protein ACI9P7_001813, partial [Candidatus Azotimanducaceae bacterium]